MKSIVRKLIMLTMITALFLWAATVGSSPTVKRLENVEATHCSACHQTPVLPDGHPDVTDESNADCSQCHEPRGEGSLRGKIPLSHTHMTAGVSCSDCHGDQRPFKNVGTDNCRKCHGDPDQVEELTKSLPVNPHTSPHYGNEMDCDMCHHLHYQSENTCNQCHEHSGITP